MKKLLLFTFFVCFTSLSFGQYENKWQPDRVYADLKVKKIIFFLKSPKIIVQIIEFNQLGKRKQIKTYSPPFNRKFRKDEKFYSVDSFQYDSNNKLIKRIDSTGNDNPRIDKTILEYDTEGNLITSRFFKGENKQPQRILKYSYSIPNKRDLTCIEDSVITSESITEYENNFYKKRDSSWSYCQKLNAIASSHLDITNLKKCNTIRTFKNTFNSKGLLIKSIVKSIYEGGRVNEFQQNYKYYKNGLIKSIHGEYLENDFNGFTPIYYKYEFWE